MWYSVLLGFVAFLTNVSEVFARGGGGGSGGGGGGGGGGGIGGSGGGSSSPINLIFIIIFIVLYICSSYRRKQQIKKAEKIVSEAASVDSDWDETLLKQRVTEVFLKFQQDWSDLNFEPMKEYLTDSYY